MLSATIFIPLLGAIAIALLPRRSAGPPAVVSRGGAELAEVS